MLAHLCSLTCVHHLGNPVHIGPSLLLPPVLTYPNPHETSLNDLAEVGQVAPGIRVR